MFHTHVRLSKAKTEAESAETTSLISYLLNGDNRPELHVHIKQIKLLMKLIQFLFYKHFVQKRVFNCSSVYGKPLTTVTDY